MAIHRYNCHLSRTFVSELLMGKTLCVTAGTIEDKSLTQRDVRAPSVEVAQDGAPTDCATVRYNYSSTTFTARRSYNASAVLTCRNLSVCPSVCHTRAL